MTVTADMFSAVLASLEAGLSTSITLMGDDSSNNPNEWFRLMAPRFATALPGARVEYRYYDDSQNRYARQASSEIFGRRAANQERCIVFNGSRPRARPQSQMAGITGDVDVAVKVAPTAWVPAAVQRFIASWGGQLSGGNTGRGWMFGLNTAGALVFSVSTDGNNQFDYASTVAPSPPAGTVAQPLWLRATRVASTGVVTFYTSSDGVAWTQLGGAVTGATGATYATTEDWTLGGRGTNSSTDAFSGRFFDLILKSSLAATAPIVNLRPIESWHSRNDTNDTTFMDGAPTLYLRNGSSSGYSLANAFDNSVKRPLLLEPFESGIVMLTTGLGEVTTYAGMADYRAKLDSWLTNVRARAPLLSQAVLTQHPFIDPRPPLRRDTQAKRAAVLPAWATRNGVGCIDTYRAFRRRSTDLSTLVSGTASAIGSKNGNDLTDDGTQVYVDTVWSAFAERLVM